MPSWHFCCLCPPTQDWGVPTEAPGEGAGGKHVLGDRTGDTAACSTSCYSVPTASCKAVECWVLIPGPCPCMLQCWPWLSDGC